MSRKFFWAVRAVIYKCFYNNVSLPSYIGPPIFISNCRNIHMGKRVRIYPGIRAEIVDKKATISIGNNVSIGQNFHVVSYNENLSIGNNVTIAGNVFITNCDHDYSGSNDSVLENDLISRSTSIGDNCFIGNNVAILAGTKLGKGCIVGANSVLRGEYPAGCVIAGSPARIIKKYSEKNKSWEKYNDK